MIASGNKYNSRWLIKINCKRKIGCITIKDKKVYATINFKMPIQRDMGNCREYENDDSQEKCYVREVLAKIRYGNISNICELEEEYAIPQIKDILGM